MNCCPGFGGTNFPVVVINVNGRWFRFFDGDNVVCVPSFQNQVHSFFPRFVVEIGELRTIIPCGLIEGASRLRSRHCEI